MRVQQLIVGRFKQAFHKMFGKQCRILHTSRIRKRRHTDPSCGTSLHFMENTRLRSVMFRIIMYVIVIMIYIYIK